MQKYTNKGSVPWYPKESRTPCKNAVNDSTIASSISWWQGWHLFHCSSPMSLQDGKKIFTDKQQLATGFACSSRTVSPDEQCYRLICASCTPNVTSLVAKRILSIRSHRSQGMYNAQSNAKHLLFHFETENTTPEFDIPNKLGTMIPWMTSVANKGAQT